MKGHARNLMAERVTAVPPDAPLDTIAAILAAERTGGAPVVDHSDQIVGFVAETDLLNALLRGLGPETTASDIMSRHPVVIDEFAPTDDVMRVLRESHIHHLPVVREGRLVGMITPTDVVRFFVEHVLPRPPEVG